MNRDEVLRIVSEAVKDRVRLSSRAHTSHDARKYPTDAVAITRLALDTLTASGARVEWLDADGCVQQWGQA